MWFQCRLPVNGFGCWSGIGANGEVEHVEGQGGQGEDKGKEDIA